MTKHWDSNRTPEYRFPWGSRGFALMQLRSPKNRSYALEQSLKDRSKDSCSLHLVQQLMQFFTLDRLGFQKLHRDRFQ